LQCGAGGFLHFGQLFLDGGILDAKLGEAGLEPSEFDAQESQCLTQFVVKLAGHVFALFLADGLDAKGELAHENPRALDLAFTLLCLRDVKEEAARALGIVGIGASDHLREPYVIAI
jgi:hypothetical protein